MNRIRIVKYRNETTVVVWAWTLIVEGDSESTVKLKVVAVDGDVALSYGGRRKMMFLSYGLKYFSIHIVHDKSLFIGDIGISVSCVSYETQVQRLTNTFTGKFLFLSIVVLCCESNFRILLYGWIKRKILWWNVVVVVRNPFGILILKLGNNSNIMACSVSIILAVLLFLSLVWNVAIKACFIFSGYSLTQHCIKIPTLVKSQRALWQKGTLSSFCFAEENKKTTWNCKKGFDIPYFLYGAHIPLKASRIEKLLLRSRNDEGNASLNQLISVRNALPLKNFKD